MSLGGRLSTQKGPAQGKMETAPIQAPAKGLNPELSCCEVTFLTTVPPPEGVWAVAYPLQASACSPVTSG